MNSQLQKFILVPVLILALLGPIFAPFAKSFNFPDRYDLVAILVEQGLYSDPSDYDGLTATASGPITKTNLKSRVDRYAQDLQTALPGTRALIIQVDRFEKTENVTAVLERLYFDGDPKEPSRIAYLKGLVIVGEVPLPVVNKNGTRFISLFPYTDFEQKAYVWNPATLDFEISGENPSPQPEIWHGVIRPPVSTQTAEGKQQLASYFDKNHLYHVGDSSYTTFGKRVLFQDFIEEAKNLNEDAYKNYLNFLNHQGDTAYLRYTRELYKDLAEPLEQEMAAQAAGAENDAAALADAGIPLDTSVPSPDIPDDADIPEASADSDTVKNAVPDIMTKVAKMSDNLMARFNQVFTKYPRLINDFIGYTGRYEKVDTAVNLITAKDQYTVSYLKAVNTMVEAKIDELINQLQKNISFGTVTLEVKKIYVRDGDDINEITDSDDEGSSDQIQFTNFSPAGIFDGNPFPDLLNGFLLTSVSSVSQCSPYRGSTGTRPYSKLVEINRALDENSGGDFNEDDEVISGRTPAEKAAGYRCNAGIANCQGYEHFGGCYYDGSKLVSDPAPGKRSCFPEHALDPVYDLAGTQEVTGAPPTNFDNYKSCLNFHEKTQYLEYLNSVDARLESFDDESNFTREQIVGRIDSHPLAPQDKVPSEITVFEVDDGAIVNPEILFTVTLESILKGLGWNAAANPNGWRQVLGDLLTSDVPPNTRTVTITHPQATSVEFNLTPTGERHISSIFYHKEPTNETLRAQAQNMMTKDLPVDNPRYVTFQDNTGNLRRLDYPDLFAAASLDAYKNELLELQNQINTLPLGEGTGMLCNNCLANLISPLSELSENPVGADTRFTRANQSKVLDAIEWKNMDIDSKHKYLFQYYLDPVKNAYIGESPHGYELVYFNGEGSASAYEFSLNKDIPEETDGVFAEGSAAAAALTREKEAPYADDPENPFDEAPAEEGGYDLFSWSPPPVSPWWERMKEWKDDLSETVSEYGFGDSEEEFYGGLEEENRRALEDIQAESKAVYDNPSAADELSFSRISDLAVATDSTTVVAGKQAFVHLELKDEERKRVTDEFGKITLTLEGDAHFNSSLNDDDEEANGFQTTIFSGVLDIGIEMPTDPGTVRFRAALDSTEITRDIIFSVVSDAHLLIESSTLAVTANGQSELTLSISARDATGGLLGAANSLVQFGISDPLLGQLSVNHIRLSGGRGSLRFRAGMKKGSVIINAVSSVLDPGTLTLSLLPGEPTRIALTADSETLPTEPGASVTVQAALYDANGNMVETNSAAEINFRLSSATERFASLSNLSQTVRNGSATVTLSPREETGTVNIIAESTGLIPAALTIKAVKKFGMLDLFQMSPENLAVALLGIPAGDVSESNFLGGWFALHGKTQAVTSLTAQPKLYKKLFEVSDRGGVRIPDASRMSAHFTAANNFALVLRDDTLQLDLARITLFALKEGQFDVTTESNPDRLADGIYVRKTSAETAYTVDRIKGALRVAKEGSEKFEIQTNGFTRIFDNNFSLRPVSGNFLVLQVLDSQTPVAEVYFVQRFNQDVRVMSTTEMNAPLDAPGVYISPLALPPQIFYNRSFVSNTTAAPRGIAFYDKSEEVRGGEAPGFAFNSLEDSASTFGVGFTQDNKFGLLFSAGEMFGEANRPYSSDIGIVIGDPTIRINNRASGGADSSFSSDVGKLIYTGASDARGLLGLDYNTDGFEDLLIVQDDGRVRLLQNNGGYDQLKDQGFILNVKNGIQDYTKLDFNNDGQMDLVIAGKVSCRKDDTCIDVYENQGGAFVRHNVHFNQTALVVTVREQDMNRDGYHDLVIADAAGDIKILYNRNGTFEEEGQLVGNVGLQINPAQNLISSVLVRYSGMTTKNPASPESVQRYQTLSIRQPNPTQEAPDGFEFAEQDFIYADLDTVFHSSTKFGEDLNGEVLRAGDRVRYTITLHNDSAAVKNGVAMSDLISDQIEIDKETIVCVDCLPAGQAGTQEITIETLTGDATRPYLIRGINIPARGARHIVYEGTFKGDTSSSDKIKIVFNNRFADSNASLQTALRQDLYPDISVTKEGNPTGRVRYFYSVGVNADRTMRWQTELSSTPTPQTAEEFEEKTGLDIPSTEEISDIPTECRRIPSLTRAGLSSAQLQAANGNEALCETYGGEFADPAGPSRASTGPLNKLQNDDSDGDGIQDSIDEVNGALDAIAESTSAAMDKLKCDAGCISLPMNAAFLSPGFFSVLGSPGPYDIGLPVFGWGAPSLIPTWPPMPPLTTAGGRFYVSPSLTGGLGFGLCLGPFGMPKNCFSFGVNPLDLISPGVCNSLSGAVSGALANANDAISQANEGITLTVGPQTGATSGGSRNGTGSGLGNYSLGSYESPVTRSRNIRIPGFPSVLTDWLARQQEEITDKALAIPDLYVIYPALDKTFLGTFTPSEDFSRTGDPITDLLSWVNSIPLFDIETQDVLFKLPILTRHEIEKFKADALQWVEDLLLELNKWKTALGCFGVPQAVEAIGTGTTTPLRHGIADPELCRFVDLEMNRLISSVVENSKRLDEWILFPKKVLQFRAIEAYYLGQIIDYLDTIINFTGGWVKRNTARVKQWRRSVRQIKDVIENWKVMIELMVDYNESCDQCKTERYSLKDLILKLFIGIPSPPVIPIPKLPDIIIDVSKIQAGLRIKWPNITFKAEPFTLPRLPRISLGINLTIPLLRAQLPAIPLIPNPPSLPQLPALPPLRLPRLPDLPPPPKMPGLPGPIRATVSILKKIVKILCIIRLGLTPTDEILLKTRIEEITARGLNPILPIDLLFTVQSPTISVTYVDQIVATAFTNFGLDFSAIQRAVEAAATQSNQIVAGFVKNVNTYLQRVMKQIETVTSPTINIGPQGVKINYQKQNELLSIGQKLRNNMQDLVAEKDRQSKLIAKIPDKLVLTAEDIPYVKNDRIANNTDIILPFQQRLQEYRDALAAHIENSPASDDLEDFRRWIAQEKSAFIGGNLKRYVATHDVTLDSTSSPTRSGISASNLRGNDIKTNEPVKIGQFDVEKITWVDPETAPAESRLLSFAVGQPPEIPTPGLAPGSGGPSGVGSVQNIGIYFVDTNGESKRLVNYTLEASRTSRLADIDIDNDGDADKIYSYGPNVFMKRNERLSEEDSRPIFRPVDLEFWTIFELLPKGTSPYFPKVLNETAHDASFEFKNSVMPDLAGYEIIAKNSPLFFEKAGAFKTVRAHVMPDPAAAAPVGELTIRLENADGEVAINNKAPESLEASIGDFISTGDNSSVLLRASDGTIMQVSENTGFVINKGGQFELAAGELEIEIPENGSALFPPATIVRVTKGSLRMRFFDGSEITVEPGVPFVLPELRKVFASVKSVSGSAQFTGQKREYIQSSSGKVHISAGEILHPLQVVELKWNEATPEERTLTLSKDIMIPIPESFATGIDIEIEEGVVEVIRKEKITQPVAAGMALFFGDEINVSTGSVTTHYARGGDTVVRFNERYILSKTESLDNPTINLAIDEGFYFAKIYGFDASGNRGSGSEKLLLSPQVCGDDSPPIANFGSTHFTLAVGKTLQLDASRSFDTEGRVIEYKLDPNGTFTNSPQFTIGPYEEVGLRQMKLTVRDEAHNEGYQDITVDVVTPRIVLEEPPLRSNIISGFVEPVQENVPITIGRLRPRTSSMGWEILRTPSSDAGGQYFTNAEGRFSLNDLDMRDRLLVRNHEGKIVAEIDTQSGRITILDERYETRLLTSSTVPPLPTRIGIFLKTDPSFGNPLTFVYFVPDVNTDTIIDAPETVYSATALRAMSGVHIKPLAAASELGINFRTLPGDDEQIPGATITEKENRRVAVVDVNGDIIISDPLIQIRQKTLPAPSPPNEPVIFELLYSNRVIAEIFIAVHTKNQEAIEIIDVPRPPPRPKPTVIRRLGQPFTDIAPTDAFGRTIEKLYTRGIVAGYPSSVRGKLLFKPENQINRAEFTQITLKMLCIIPREEAKKLPSPFYDLLNPRLWFYPVLKEGNIRGFIRGYTGESRADPVTGALQTPFKPATNITRAEAATVVLAALAEEDMIDISKVNFTPSSGAPWYEKYLEVAQDIKPYLKNQGETERAFIITAEEARNPNRAITRRDFATMAERVLLIYDCHNPDSDGDKLPDTWEYAQGKTPLEIIPDQDPDADQCTNAKEYEVGTNPFEADTDKGGVADCVEVNNGTNPTNTYDDRPQAPPELLRNEEGIFVIRPSCGDVCPCRAYLEPGGDLHPGDIIFAAITGPNGLPIYAQSNEEIY